MKLETAQALKWPWPVDYGIKNPVYYVQDNIPREIRFPSLKEILKQMPVGTTLRKGVNGFTAAYRKDIWNKQTGWDKTRAKSVRDEEAEEALALLAIWLRDNNLMEGWEK